jgi:hypothetical protein
MNKKVVFAIISLLVIVIGAAAAVFLASQNQDIRKSAAPATSLALVPSTSSPKVNSQFNVSLNIDTSTNNVIAAELYINYDPTKLELLTVDRGAFFTGNQQIGPTIDNTLGKLSYTLLLSPGATPVQGRGTVALLTFRAKAQGAAIVSIATNTIIGALGENAQNVLLNPQPLTITIASAAAAANPTVTPTASPAALGGGANTTPSPTPKTSATPKASVSTSPTASPVTSGNLPPLPESGVGLPTIVGVSLGVVLLVTSFVILR